MEAEIKNGDHENKYCAQIIKKKYLAIFLL